MKDILAEMLAAYGADKPEVTTAQILAARVEYGKFGGLRFLELPISQLLWHASAAKATSKPLKAIAEKILAACKRRNLGAQSPMVLWPAALEIWKEQVALEFKEANRGVRHALDRAAELLERIFLGTA